MEVKILLTSIVLMVVSFFYVVLVSDVKELTIADTVAVLVFILSMVSCIVSVLLIIWS